MQYNVPGVYVEERPSLPPSVASVGSAIPAFIGHTQSHVGGVTVRRIQSFLEYKSHFGGPEPYVRVTAAGAITVDPLLFRMYYALQHYFMNGGGACYIVSVGGYTGDPKDGVSDGLDALQAHDEPTLYVMPDAIASADYNPLLQLAVAKCAALGDRIVLADCDHGLLDQWRQGSPQGGISLHGVVSGHEASYCAAYAPYVETTIAPEVDFTGVNASVVHQVRAIVGGMRVTLPPTPAVAAAYVVNDATRGVAHAPANMPLKAVKGPVMAFTQPQLAALNLDPNNGNSINVIRSFTGKGTLIYGARTLYGNSNEWRYVSVRRFYNMVEESVKKATRQFVFAPNTPETWQAIKTMVSNYLGTLWNDGALMGATPQEAFFVRVGRGETMTDAEIQAGQLIVRIGMAVSRPAEFVVLQFSHFLPQA